MTTHALPLTSAAAPAPAKLWMKRPPLFVSAFWFATVLLLYAPLYNIKGDYYLSWGGLIALMMLVLHPPIFNLRALLMFAFLTIYPIGIYLLHVSNHTVYGIEFLDFADSFMLWFASAGVLTSAFFANPSPPRVPINACLAVLTVLGIFQFVAARMFGSTIGFDLIAPLVSFDIYDSYLRILVVDSVRAMGTYYEPSMFGRVIATLAAMQLITTRRPLLPAFYMAVNALTCQSVGLVILTFLVFGIWYGKPSSRWFPLTLFGMIALAASWGFLESRINRDLELEGSSYVRLVQPVSAVAETIVDYPLGVPVGTNETVTRRLLAPQGFTEDYISNGVYEFILYSGMAGFALIIFALFYMARLTFVGRKQSALIVGMLIFGTIASSSFLSIEASLLMYIFIHRMRASEAAAAGSRAAVPPVRRHVARVPAFSRR